MISMKLTERTRNTLTLMAKNLIEISLVVSEIWPGKVESKGGACLFRQVRLFGEIQYVQFLALHQQIKQMKSCQMKKIQPMP